jgi:hypothetical protein
MVLEVSHTFYPYRMVLTRKTPIELSINLTNKGSEPALASLQIALPRTLGLDKSGLQTGKIKQLGALQPGEVKQMYFDIYPKAGITEGEQALELTAFEHYKDYGYVSRKVVRTLSFRVDH